MSDIASRLTSQICTQSDLPKQNITPIEIKFFPQFPQNSIKFVYTDKAMTPVSRAITSIPNPKEILTLFAEHLRTVTSEISFPKNCVINDIHLNLKDQLQMEITIHFHISLPLQKAILSVNKQQIPHKILQKDNFHFTNSQVFFNNDQISSNQFSVLTQDEELAHNPPKHLSLKAVQPPKKVSKTSGLLVGSSNSVWKNGQTTVPYPAYRVTYVNQNSNKTLYQMLQKQARYILRGFNKPKNYILKPKSIDVTNGQSTGKFATVLLCPITQ